MRKQSISIEIDIMAIDWYLASRIFDLLFHYISIINAALYSRVILSRDQSAVSALYNVIIK